MAEPELITFRHADGYEAAARWWPPARQPKPTAGVLYFHGIQSHGGWFERSGERLASAGFAVLMPDRRGSGRNERDRGHADSADRLVADAGEWMDELRRRSGCEAIHVVGVSWGGKLALNLFEARPRDIASLSLVAPGLFPVVDIPRSEKVRVAWSAITSPLVGRRLFDIPINEPEMFTATPEWLEFLRRDPLRLRQVTADFLIASRRLDRFTRRAHLHAGVPIRVYLAEIDRIIDNEKTRQWVRDLGWPVREIAEYRGAHHTLEFEPADCTYIHDLADWIAKR